VPDFECIFGGLVDYAGQNQGKAQKGDQSVSVPIIFHPDIGPVFKWISFEFLPKYNKSGQGIQLGTAWEARERPAGTNR
jgi:hypothetical protein